MLQHYDRTAAAATLGAITENRTNSPHSQLQLAKLFVVSMHLKQYQYHLPRNF